MLRSFLGRTGFHAPRTQAELAGASLVLLVALTGLVGLIAVTFFRGTWTEAAPVQILMVLASWLVFLGTWQQTAICGPQNSALAAICGSIATLPLALGSSSAAMGIAICGPMSGLILVQWASARLLVRTGPPDSLEPARATAGANNEVRAEAVHAPIEETAPLSSPEFELAADQGETEQNVWEQVQQELKTDPELVQCVARWSNPGGGQSLLILARCTIPPNAVSATVQVPVWPFFESSPEVFCRVIGGTAATVRPNQIRLNGMTFDVQLPAPVATGESAVVLLEITALTAAVAKGNVAA